MSVNGFVNKFNKDASDYLNGRLKIARFAAPFQRFRYDFPGLCESRYYLLSAGTKGAKCFGKGTRIRMADNTIKNIEDIRVGDFVMSPGHELPKRVENIGHGEEELYEITSIHNDKLIVNKSHIMYLYMPKKKQYVTMTIEELIKEQNSLTNISFKRKYRCVTSDECEFGTHYSNLPIEPYYYGLWLGDGETNGDVITTPDNEIVEYLKGYAERLGMKLSTYTTNNRCNRYAITRKQHNCTPHRTVLGSVCKWQKETINRQYMNASISDRYELLAGLIDTDGYLNPHKTGYQITLQHLSLIKDIQELARSLGLSTVIDVKYNKQYNKNYYELRISGRNCVKIPVRIKRKQCRPTTKDFRHYAFDIKSIGVGEYYGITLNGNHLFLTEDYTIVHNTQMTVHVIADAITQYMSTLLNGNFPEVKPCFVYIPLEESENDILARLYSWFFFNVLGERVDKDEIVFSSPKVCNDSVIKIQNLMNDDRTKLFTEVLDECFCVKEVANFNDIMTVLYSITKVCDSDDMNSYFFFAGNGLTKDTTVDLPCMATHEGQANLRMVIIDHISLLPLASGEKIKGTIDKLSTILVYIRNKFKISSWVVQQQNKETYNASAKSSGEIEPSVSGLADSSYTARDCNLFLAVANPYYFKLNSYKSFHDLDLFGDGIRFLSVVANRNGVPGGWIGLDFDGCCQTFAELPKQSDVENFEAARERIRLRQFQIG